MRPFVLLFSVLLVGCDSGNSESEVELTFPAEIEYRVDGTAELGAIRYYGAGEEYVNPGIPQLPFSHTFTAQRRQLLFLIARALDDGELRIELLANGQTIKSTAFQGPHHSQAIGAGDDDDTREVFYFIDMVPDSSSGVVEIMMPDGMRSYNAVGIDRISEKFQVTGSFRARIRATAVRCGAFSMHYAPQKPPYLTALNKVVFCDDGPESFDIDLEVPGAN